MDKKILRPPVVVVLGHVDHGKTSLLDIIRKTNVVEKEAGRITQRIGAYQVKTGIAGYEMDTITFIDTPGHEAFTKLRLRGSQVADIAILLISAVDSIMPQTVESIYHIKNAGIPFIVAINKVDMPNALPDKVMKDLLKHDVQVEGMGGTIPCVSISATKGTGIEDLLEGLLLVSSEHHYTYDPDADPEVYSIEAKQSTGGVEVACIIKNGTLSIGDTLYAQESECKVRALVDSQGVRHTSVIPSMPFLLLGFSKLPDVGVLLTTTAVKPEEVEQAKLPTSFEDFFAEKKKTLPVIIKADSTGSLEAICDLLNKIDMIHIDLAAVGEITKSDIFLAKLSKAVIVGFSVRATKDVENIAKQEKVLIKHYSIIYELIDELQEVASIMEEKEKKQIYIKGEAKIVASFIIEDQQIAGVNMLKGKLAVGDHIDLIRNDRVIGTSQVTTLRQKAKSIRELQKGQEGGMSFDPFIDFKIGDVIKSYSI